MVSPSFKSKRSPIRDNALYSKIISVGEDAIMHIYDCKLNVLKKIDTDSEFYAISSNSIDKIAVGGLKNQIDIHTVSNLIEDAELLSNPFLGMKFESNITKIQWIGKFIMGFSEDSHLSLLNTDND